MTYLFQSAEKKHAGIQTEINPKYYFTEILENTESPKQV